MVSWGARSALCKLSKEKHGGGGGEACEREDNPDALCLLICDPTLDASAL